MLGFQKNLTWNRIERALSLPTKFLCRKKIHVCDVCLEYRRVSSRTDPSMSAAGSGPQVDEDALNQLLAMGFPEVRCRKALIKTGNNGPDVAMNWLFEHMEDPGMGRLFVRFTEPVLTCTHPKDIDDPIQTVSAGGSGTSEADLSQLMDMGFTKEQAARALKETACSIRILPRSWVLTSSCRETTWNGLWIGCSVMPTHSLLKKVLAPLPQVIFFSALADAESVPGKLIRVFSICSCI